MNDYNLEATFYGIIQFGWTRREQDELRRQATAVMGYACDRRTHNH